jgi:hypothetical protein
MAFGIVKENRTSSNPPLTLAPAWLSVGRYQRRATGGDKVVIEKEVEMAWLDMVSHCDEA